MMYCWLSFFIKNIVHCCLLHGYVQSGGWGLENPLCSHCFSIFSTIQGKTVARNFWNFCSEALQLMSTIFIVHCYLDHYAFSFSYHAWICFSNHEGLKFEPPLVWWSFGDFKSSLWRKAFEPLLLWLLVISSDRRPLALAHQECTTKEAAYLSQCSVLRKWLIKGIPKPHISARAASWGYDLKRRRVRSLHSFINCLGDLHICEYCWSPSD